MTVRTKTKREKLAEREEAIVSAATKAFLSGGLRAAKMSEIARAADVAEGTLYLYFKNKEALFAAIVTRHWQDLTEGAEKVVAGAEEPQEQLDALARYTLRRILSDWKLFELSFVLHYGSGEADDASDKRGYVRVFDAVVQRGIDRGEFAPTVPPRFVRDLFFGTMEYAVRSMLRKRQKNDVDDALTMLSAALGGVLQPGPAASTQDLASRIEAAVGRLESLAQDSGQRTTPAP